LSDTKKYYYLKLKDNYFDQDNIKVLESLPNGHLYSLIILKLYLKACKYNGHLKMTESIPYDPKKINILAQVINHDQDNVKEAIKLGTELGLITMIESGQMWMTEIQNYIGQSSSEGDRKREYRNRLGQMSGLISDKQAPEIEIDKEIKKEKEKKSKVNLDEGEIIYECEFFKVYDKRNNNYKEFHPTLNLITEYKKARQWLLDNEKTMKKWTYITNWLNRAEEYKKNEPKKEDDLDKYCAGYHKKNNSISGNQQ
jgi:predicted phage replisome organizer